MKALVTGGGGFLGQYIVEQLLNRGDQVRSLSRNRYPALDQLGSEQIEGDLRDAKTVNSACQDIDTVFHVAAIAGIWGDRKVFEQINTQGTLNVIDSCRKNEVHKLVYCSSPSVIFDSRDQNGVDETTPYPQKWLCDYPRTKGIGRKGSVGGEFRGH